MPRFRLVAITLATLLSCAAPVRAQVPDPSHSTISSAYIDVVGWTACATGRCPDPRGLWIATIRDYANNVVPGAVVSIDFSGCPDVVIECDPLTAETGQSLAAPGVVQATTDANGQATFHVQGRGNVTRTGGADLSPGTPAGVRSAVVSVLLPGAAQPEALAMLEVVVLDLDGAGTPGGAVSGADVSLAAYESGRVSLGAAPRERDDYNHSNTISGADVAMISKLAGQAALGFGSQNTRAVCP